MTIWRQDELLLNAYLDGELDAIEAVQFETRLATEPALAAGIEARRSLKAALRTGLDEDVPSPALRRRILAQLSLHRPRGTQSWQSLAASFLLGTIIAGALSLAVMQNEAGDQIADAMVSNHIRALMAPQPTDIPSSDHHTVKPWFNGKVAFAPVVPELGPEGFSLVGARLDVVALKPVATIVYSYGKHLISLTQMPSESAVAQPVTRKVERGYLMLWWSERGIEYWAVSDAAHEELERFVGLFQAAASHP